MIYPITVLSQNRIILFPEGVF